MRQRILSRLKRDRRSLSILELSRKTLVPYASLYRIIHDGKGHMKNWEKLDRYYHAK